MARRSPLETFFPQAGNEDLSIRAQGLPPNKQDIVGGMGRGVDLGEGLSPLKAVLPYFEKLGIMKAKPPKEYTPEQITYMRLRNQKLQKEISERMTPQQRAAMDEYNKQFDRYGSMNQLRAEGKVKDADVEPLRRNAFAALKNLAILTGETVTEEEFNQNPEGVFGKILSALDIYNAPKGKSVTVTPDSGGGDNKKTVVNDDPLGLGKQ